MHFADTEYNPCTRPQSVLFHPTATSGKMGPDLRWIGLGGRAVGLVGWWAGAGRGCEERGEGSGREERGDGGGGGEGGRERRMKV